MTAVGNTPEAQRLNLETLPQPQGFSEIFLKALSKFDGAICVVTDPAPSACLQGETLRWFNATEPDLIGKILAWIGAILLES